MEKLLTVKELSEFLQVNPSTVYKWVHYRFVPCVKIGDLVRFRQSKIEIWLKKRERKGRRAYKRELSI